MSDRISRVRKKVEKYVHQYLELGGEPWRLRQIIREAAEVTKARTPKPTDDVEEEGDEDDNHEEEEDGEDEEDNYEDEYDDEDDDDDDDDREGDSDDQEGNNDDGQDENGDGEDEGAHGDADKMMLDAPTEVGERSHANQRTTATPTTPRLSGRVPTASQGAETGARFSSGRNAYERSIESLTPSVTSEHDRHRRNPTTARAQQEAEDQLYQTLTATMTDVKDASVSTQLPVISAPETSKTPARSSKAPSKTPQGILKATPRARLRHQLPEAETSGDEEAQN